MKSTHAEASAQRGRPADPYFPKENEMKSIENDSQSVSNKLDTVEAELLDKVDPKVKCWTRVDLFDDELVNIGIFRVDGEWRLAIARGEEPTCPEAVVDAALDVQMELLIYHHWIADLLRDAEEQGKELLAKALAADIDVGDGN
jgi:hypothetical protein